MSEFRWWLFKKISRIGWAVCPEPHRSRLYQSLHFSPNWKDALPQPQQVPHD